jgi:hypothetical protein
MIVPEHQNSSDRLNFQWDSQARQQDMAAPLKDGRRDLGEFFLFIENFEHRGNPRAEVRAESSDVFTL